MRKIGYAAALVLTAAAFPAHGCVIMLGLNVSDIRLADVVVVGRVTNYEVLTDRRKRPADAGYARFDVIVDEVLKGEAPAVVSATWDDWSFAEPEVMPPGPHLIALRSPEDRPVPAAFTVLQSPCAPAFIIDSTSEAAVAARKELSARRR